MHQPQWSMFRHGQCFGVVSVQMWVMFEVPQEMSLAGTLDVSRWSMPCQSKNLQFFKEMSNLHPLIQEII